MSRPGDRVVPTLTEVLDEQYWQAADLPEVRAAAPAPLPELPRSAESPIDLIDLSELAVLGVGVSQAASEPAGLEPQDESADSHFPSHHIAAELPQELLESELDPVLRQALSNALIEAIPDMVDLLLPLMRRQLSDDLLRLTAVRAVSAESQR